MVVNPQFGPDKVFTTLRALETRSTQARAWGPKVKWVSSVTTRILGVMFNKASRDWWVSEVNSVTLYYCGTMASCLPSTHLTREEYSWFALASPSSMLGAEARSGKSSAYDFMSKSGIGQSETNWLKRDGGNDGSLWEPRPHLARRRMVLLIEARGLSATKVCHKPPHQIVSMSGAVDHLNKEAMTDCVECHRDVYRYSYCSARGPETTLAELGSWAESVECLGLKPCWEGRVPSASAMDRRRAAPISLLPGRAVRWEQPWSRGFPAFKIRIMKQFFQIAGISTPATERLKSSVRKTRLCSPRWRRWSTVSPSIAPGWWNCPFSLWPLRRLSRRTACMRDPHCDGPPWAFWVPDRVGWNRQWSGCWRLV